MSRIPGLSRAVGTAAGSALALALLVAGCVFAAMAGPALSLHTQSQALHQTLAGLAVTTSAVQVTAQFQDFDAALQPIGGGNLPIMKRSELDQTSREIGQGFSALRLPLAAGDVRWAGLSTRLFVVKGAGPRAKAALAPQLEVVYRDPLPANTRLTAGTYATAKVPAGALGVAATTQMAYRFGLHPGSRLSLQTPSGAVRLYVTAIVAERAPASTFWMQDATIATPSLTDPSTFPYWVGGVIADPDQFVAVQNALVGPGLEMYWDFPLDVGGVTAAEVRGLQGALTNATNSPAGLTGALEPAADTLTVTSPLMSNLSLFLATQAAIETVLLLLFVSLIVIGAAVILIAARMIVARREVELAMLRARGGSLRQVAALTARTGLLAAVPAAAVGAGLAILLIPGDSATSSAAGWWLAGVAVAAALAGPPLIAAWQHRKPAPAANPAQITTADTSRRRPAWRRPVAELTGCAAAAAGLIVLHDQGIPAGGGIDLYLTITPVLVAIPVVIIMLRLYPLAVRALLRLSARSTGATSFVAMSRAARSSLTGVLPAFALVLALSLATFAGMTSNGITNGEIAASWHTTGADVVIDAGPFPVTPSALSAIAAVRGVRHAIAIWTTNWATPVAQPVTVVAVDPSAYAALVASTPLPAFPAAAIRAAPGGVRSSGPPVPVLASPAAAALLGSGATQLSSSSPEGPFTVRVAGTIGDTPAEPGGGTFVIMPLETLPGATGAAPQRGPGHRLGHRPGPAVRGDQHGDPARRRHLPLRGARLAGQLPAAARRGADHRADHGRRRGVRPVHRDPRPGPRVGGARADPGQAHRHGPPARDRARHGRGDARRDRRGGGGRRRRGGAAARGRLVDRPVRVHRHQRAGPVAAGRARARPARRRHLHPRPGRADRPGPGAAPSGYHRHAPGTIGKREAAWAPASPTWARKRPGSTVTSARAH